MGKFKLFGSGSSQQRMGCTGSKDDRDGGGGGGPNKSDRNNTSGPSGSSSAYADPRIPMTAKQKYSIVASWKGISRAIEPTGVCMFVKLFEEHAELLNLFEKFQELKTRQQQEESMELAEHATMVMSTLDQAIRSLDNPDAFVQQLERVGSTHKRIPGFNSDFFWKIEKPFLAAVKTTLEDRYTENIESIYKIVIRLILERLVKGYEESK